MKGSGFFLGKNEKPQTQEKTSLRYPVPPFISRSEFRIPDSRFKDTEGRSPALGPRPVNNKRKQKLHGFEP
jgi:hypothetical protein